MLERSILHQARKTKDDVDATVDGKRNAEHVAFPVARGRYTKSGIEVGRDFELQNRYISLNTYALKLYATTDIRAPFKATS